MLDECHKAKNLLNDQGNPTQTGFAVEYLQERVPDAAVLYSSATGISEPQNMAYMTRLGRFGHHDMGDLIAHLKGAGLGASELFSCSLKANGIYLARCAACYAFDVTRRSCFCVPAASAGVRVMQGALHTPFRLWLYLCSVSACSTTLICCRAALYRCMHLGRCS